MATGHARNRVRPVLYWVVFVLIVVLFATATRQWRTNGLLEEDNQRLQVQLGALEDIKAENIDLQRQRDRLLRSQDSEMRLIQSLRAEVQQLRERTNELGIAHLAHARASAETELLKAENLSLKAELASKPRVPRIGGWLGVSIRNIPQEERKPNAMSGVVVTAVVSGSPAQQASLKMGDVVLSVDGQSITGTDDFKTIMAQKAGGRLVALDVAREDGFVRVDVKPLDWPQ